MAQVLEAVSQGMEGFERRVAIKRLLPQHLRDGGRRRMFFDEASIGSRLHHGGVVQIFDYGLIDGAAFLAMEFVDGVDALRAVTLWGDDRVMPEGIALHLISEVAHALAYIHDVKDEFGEPLGIVHRDVSPQNILLSWDGDVKLSDFGIALSLQREERTSEGVVKGKLPYMPPEQALGKRVDAAADVYALGATLATLLGERAMGPAMTDEEVWARVGAARDRGVSAAVAELIGACTCREPSARLRAADVAAAAGSLAFQKLSRCTRGSLSDWLAPLKPKDQEGSALDDLMGLCLVPVGNDGGRTFTVSQMIPLSQSREACEGRVTFDPGDARGATRDTTISEPWDARGDARTSAGIEIQSAIPTPLSRAQRIGRAARWTAAAAVVAIAATFTAWRPGTAPAGTVEAAGVTAPRELARSAPSSVASAAASSAVAADLPQVHAPGDGASPSASSRAASPSAGFHAGGGASSVPSARRARRLVSLVGRGAPAMVSPDSPERGWLRVGGPGLFGGQVTVDGVTVGFAPLERSLPLGSHAITVVSPGSNQTLVHQTIRLGGHHTRVKPLRLLR
jgi:serine/threonine protein kinase